MSSFATWQQMTRSKASSESPHLLLITAESEEGVRTLAGRYSQYLRDDGRADLRDICYTAARRRHHYRHRACVAGGSIEDMAVRCSEVAQGVNDSCAIGHDLDSAEEPVRTVFVFPGQGSQWAGMGRQLLGNAAFRESMTRCDAAVSKAAGWSVMQILEDAPSYSELPVSRIQPILWAMEVSLAAQWRALGVTPDLVVGHSMGEIAAACVAGILTHEDAAAVVVKRSSLADAKTGAGGMLFAEISPEKAVGIITGQADRVSLAAVNSPESVVLSGDTEALQTIEHDLAASEVFARLVQVDFASHSYHMDSLIEPLTRDLACLSPTAGHVPLYSTVESRPIDGREMNASYWAANLRRPVQLVDALLYACGRGPVCFIEVSPHPILLSAIRKTVERSNNEACVVATTRRDAPESETMLMAAAQVAVHGGISDWSALYPEGRTVTLPSYPWDLSDFWIGPTAQQPGLLPGAGELVAHDVISMEGCPYLADHVVNGRTVVPPATFVGLAIDAAADLTGAPVKRLTSIKCYTPLIVEHGTEAEVRTTICPGPDGVREFVIEDGDGRMRYASGQFSPHSGMMNSSDQPKAIAGTAMASAEAQEPGEFYREMASLGYELGPRLRWISSIARTSSEAVLDLTPPPVPEDGSDDAALEACLHTALVLAQDLIRAGAMMGFSSIDSLILHGNLGSARKTHGTIVASSDDEITTDIVIFGPGGDLLAEVRGLRARRFGTRPARPAAPWSSITIPMELRIRDPSGSTVYEQEGLTAEFAFASSMPRRQFDSLGNGAIQVSADVSTETQPAPKLKRAMEGPTSSGHDGGSAEGNGSGPILGAVAAVLGTTVDRLTPDRPLKAQGLDSLMALELRRRLEEKGILCGAEILLSRATLHDVVNELQSRKGRP